MRLNFQAISVMVFAMIVVASGCSSVSKPADPCKAFGYEDLDKSDPSCPAELPPHTEANPYWLRKVKIGGLVVPYAIFPHTGDGSMPKGGSSHTNSQKIGTNPNIDISVKRFIGRDIITILASSECRVDYLQGSEDLSRVDCIVEDSSAGDLIGAATAGAFIQDKVKQLAEVAKKSGRSYVFVLARTYPLPPEPPPSSSIPSPGQPGIDTA